MENNLAEFPFLSNIGFMLTFKCTIACPHCIVEAGPHRKEEMRLGHCLTWIDQARAFRDGQVKGIALTGGEPFYNLDHLVRISAYGRALGLIVSVVTNAFWASSKEKALSVLAKLPAIQMISISTDVYHQKSIPFAHIKNAIWAAKELGRLYNIAVCTDDEQNPQYRQIVEDLTAIGEADRIKLAITFPVGRAQKQAHRFHFRTSPEPAVAACSVASSPVVFPNGGVNACIGPLLTLPPTHPLFLGNLYQESLAEILDRAELNPVLHTIRVWGPYKLVSLLQQNGFGVLLPKEYTCNCICDVCYKLLSDGRIVDALQGILQDEQMKQVVAYARLYYLNETRMAEQYHLYATDPL
jgi:sulfatase maturation enzyme AslB (radical SAM superfamily)